jgi:hypothetical protein
VGNTCSYIGTGFLVWVKLDLNLIINPKYSLLGVKKKKKHRTYINTGKFLKPQLNGIVGDILKSFKYTFKK